MDNINNIDVIADKEAVVIDEDDEECRKKKRVVSRSYILQYENSISKLESRCTEAFYRMKDNHAYNDLDLNYRSNLVITQDVVGWYKDNYSILNPVEYELLSDDEDDDSKVYDINSNKNIKITAESKIVPNISFADRLKGKK